MDLSKAFDIVNHDILLYKLNYYGVRGIPLRWFQSYLHNRYQYTVFNEYSSGRSLVKNGVPQGSILGPLLFVLYVNDIIKSSDKFEFTMYADDTTLFYTQPNVLDLEHNVNFDLCKVSKWFKANRLLINKKKTNFMTFCLNITFETSNSLSNITICIDSIPLKKVNAVNFLGVYIDCNLKWDTHVNNIICKVSRCIGILFKLKYYLSDHALFSLYNALVLPHLSYCVSVWGNCGKLKMNILFKLQKKVLRICTSSHYLAHSAPLFIKLKTLNIFDLYQYHTSVLGFLYFHNLLPNTISNMFPTNLSIHNYNTRNRTNFHRCKIMFMYEEKSPRCNLPVIWNSLPKYIPLCNNQRLFKKYLKSILLCPNTDIKHNHILDFAVPLAFLFFLFFVLFCFLSTACF